jgi:hypothetical protein
MEDYIESIKLALEEMRLYLSKVENNGDSLDQKANFILTASGLVLTFVSAIQLTLANALSSPTKTILLLLALILYVFLIIISAIAMRPAHYSQPIRASWETLHESLLTKPEYDALLSLISGYIDRINTSNDINTHKAKFIRWGFLLMPTIFILLVVAAIVK